jgi:hypothetical protein
VSTSPLSLFGLTSLRPFSPFSPRRSARPSRCFLDRPGGGLVVPDLRQCLANAFPRRRNIVRPPHLGRI